MAGSALALVLGGNAQAATFTVTNTSDSGAGSLRQAILAANTTAGADTINFTLTTPATIKLTTGELHITDAVTITGPGADKLTLSGEHVSRIFLIDGPEGGGMAVALSGMTLTNGVAAPSDPFGTSGGAILSGYANVDISATTITGNVAANTGSIATRFRGIGGGIAVYYGNVTLTQSTVSGNVAGNTGTATHDDGGTGYGGGIVVYNGNVTLTQSTVSGNVAGNTGTVTGISANGLGGGILIFINGNLTLTQSTVSGNVAGNTGTAPNGAGIGGGISLSGPNRQDLTVTNSTISGNIAGNTAGAGYGVGGRISTNFFGGPSGTILVESSTVVNNTAMDGGEGSGGGGIASNAITLHNTIVAGNTGGPGTTDLRSEGGSFLTTYSLIQDPGDATLDESAAPGSNILGQAPQLGPLQNNGGPTQTHAPLGGSPVINHGDPNNFQPTDQRGVARPIGGVSDMGAVEAGLFTGFFQPVDNPPVVNQVKAGQSIPVKFSLGGNLGLNILAANSPTFALSACTVAAPVDVIAPTDTAGGSGLTYDATTTTYTYVWKTQKAWAGKCGVLSLTLRDGTVHTAQFQFK